MKRILFGLLLICAIGCLQAAPLNESFEGEWLPSMWSLDGGAGYHTRSWEKVSTLNSPLLESSFYDGTACAGIYVNDAPYGWKPHNDYLVSPEITPDASNYMFTFYAKQAWEGCTDHFQVLLQTVAGPSPLVVLDSDALAYLAWNTYSYDLSAYIGIPVYVSIRAYGNYGNGLLLVDKVTGPEVTGTPPPPICYTAPTIIAFGNQRMGTHSAVQDVYIRNTGGSVLTIQSVSIVGAGASSYILSDIHSLEYPKNLSVLSDTIIVHVVFQPTSVDLKNADLQIEYGIDGIKNVPLSGTGVDSDAGGIFYPSQTEADFGLCRPGAASSVLNLMAYNIGTGDLEIASTSMIGPGAPDFIFTDTNSYPFTIDVYNPPLPIVYLSVQIAFAPSTLGVKSAILRFTDSYGANHDIPLMGECVQYLPQGIPFTESFDWVPLAPEWSITDVSGTAGDWTVYIPGPAVPDCEPYSGDGCIRFNSSAASLGTTLLETGQLQLADVYAARMEFWMYHDNGIAASDDRVTIQIDPGTEIWSSTSLTVNRYQSGAPGWSKYIMDLSPLIGTNNGRIGFLGISENGNDMYIDEVSFIVSTPSPVTAYISEVCDNKDGQPASTGFIEISSKVTYTQDISDYRIRRGTFDEFGSFMLDDPEVTYFIPPGTLLGAGTDMLIIGNGADEATFKAAWGITGSINYISGDASLDITCGEAYELWSYVHPTRFEGEVDISPLIAVGLDAVHNVATGWTTSAAINGTPGQILGTSILAAPTNIELIMNGADLELHWNAVSSAMGYKIEHASTPQGPWQPKTSVDTNQLIHPQTDTTAVEFFRVRATPDSIITRP